MKSRLRLRSVLRTVCLMILTWAGCLYAVIVWNSRTVPLYTGKTTLSLSGTSIQRIAKSDTRYSLGTLESIALGDAVARQASRTLGDIGIRLSPRYIRDHLKVQTIEGAGILAIEVTLPVTEQCTVAADVVAHELKREYSMLGGERFRRNMRLLERQVEREAKALSTTQAALRSDAGRGVSAPHGKRRSAGEAARLTVDAQVETKTYALLKVKLAEARLTEQHLRNGVQLRTIDPAYVFPVDQGENIRLIAAILTGWVPGLLLASLWRLLTARRSRSTERDVADESPAVSMS